MTTKICRTCNKTKPLINFYKTKSNKDGFKNECKACTIERTRLYKLNNKILKPKVTEEDKAKRKREYRIKYRSRRAELQKEKLNSDPLFKLKRNLRNRVWALMKGYKSKKTVELLGASFEDAKNHIESTFTEGMSWENYGEWHVDHKIPLASANSEEELEELFHYKNLQALWASENSSKKDKLIY